MEGDGMLGPAYSRGRGGFSNDSTRLGVKTIVPQQRRKLSELIAKPCKRAMKDPTYLSSTLTPAN